MGEDKDKKGGGRLEKILMGAVIGGAIGSVIGAKMNPQKKREVKKDISDAAIIVTKTAKSSSIKIFKWIKEIIENKKKIPYEDGVNKKNEI